MSKEKEAVDAYMATIDRMEPNVAPIDASAFYASAAISLKRIADLLELSMKMSSVSRSALNTNDQILLDEGTELLNLMCEKGTLDDQNGGLICIGCGSPMKMSKIKHTEDCLWIAACKLIAMPIDIKEHEQ